jgi:hypothetical protein
MKLKDKNSIFKNDKIEKEVLNNQRKTNIKILNYIDLKNLGLLNKN